jgi:Holliday junction resolvase RusA-like endonuclease
VPPLEGRICLRAAFYQANNIRQDISNRIKALEDALMYAGAYHDDSQIDKLIIERRFSKRATCVVELEEIA